MTPFVQYLFKLYTTKHPSCHVMLIKESLNPKGSDQMIASKNSIKVPV